MPQARQTRILATLGPATESAEAIAGLLDAGANLFRLNMTHAAPDWARAVAGRIRAAAAERDEVPGIVMDLQGPSIRTGQLPAPIELHAGDRFDLSINPEAMGERLASVNYPGFLNDIAEDAVIMVDNGLIRMRVLRITDTTAECEVEIGGEMGHRRHINLPGTQVKLPALTAKDEANAALGLELGVDFISLSFVREAADVAQLRVQLAGAERPPKVVAKIEDQFAVAHVDEIIAAADAVMVARGDLGVECPFEDLPILQRRIVRACQLAGKPVIVATHMLESMTGEPMPTRAEVTDVANAVYEQADAIMLSSETSVGEFPGRSVDAMDRIARRMEREPAADFHQSAPLDDPRQKLAKAAVGMADDLAAAALLVFTREGRMVPEVAHMRPRRAPIFALCLNAAVAGSLALHRAVHPVLLPWDESDPETAIQAALKKLSETGHLQPGDTVVIVSSREAIEEIADSVQMRQVAN